MIPMHRTLAMLVWAVAVVVKDIHTQLPSPVPPVARELPSITLPTALGRVLDYEAAGPATPRLSEPTVYLI